METMAKKPPHPRRSFTAEFKAEVVELIRQPGEHCPPARRRCRSCNTGGPRRATRIAQPRRLSGPQDGRRRSLADTPR